MRTSDLILLFAVSAGLIFASCEKDDAVNPVEEQQPKTGELTVEVFSCNPQLSPNCQDDINPLSGALVQVIPNDSGPEQDSSMSKLTLADGEAEFRNLSPGTYLIRTEYIDREDESSTNVFANANKFHRVIFLED